MNLEKRMKMYEKHDSRCFLPTMPVIIRLDGKNFSRYTKNFKKPFSSELSEVMILVTERLVKESNALVGYTQSDEITLILYAEKEGSEIYFNGKKQKLVSVLASFATAHFNDLIRTNYDAQYLPLAFFDCRAFQVPTKEEATNVLMWREHDAITNSVQMAGDALFSHNTMLNMGVPAVKQKLLDFGIDWNHYPVRFKRGTYIRKIKNMVPFTAEEIEKLPLKHEARTNPDLLVERNIIERTLMPPFKDVANRIGVIFNGEIPLGKPLSEED